MPPSAAPHPTAEILDRPPVDALIGCDGHGRITVWNEPAAQLFGYEESEIVGQSYIVLVPPRFRAGHEQAVRANRGRPHASLMGKSRRWIGLRKDGSELEFEMSLRWWSVKEGTCIAGSISPVLDSGVSRAERPVVQALKYDNTIAEAIPQLVWLSNVNGRLVYCNQRWYEYFGLSAADLGSAVERVILHADEQQQWMEKWVQALASEQPFEHESRLRRADGEYRWFLSRSIPLRDEHGRVHHWFGTSTDIHDQKMAQAQMAAQRDELESLVALRTQELRETVAALEEESHAHEIAQRAAQASERRLQAALDGARDFVWESDCASDRVYRSSGWSTMLGYPETRVDSTSDEWIMNIHPGDQKRTMLHFRQFIAGEVDYYDAEYRVRDACGAWRWIASRGKIVERDESGLALKAAGTSADITLRKAEREALQAAKEEAERASRAKSDFLANMSHELRTPLNSVIGFANVLRKNRGGRLGLSDLTFLDRIQANGVHLLRLIDDVLDLAKVESGRMVLALETIRLDELIRETVAQSEGQFRDGVRMVTVLPAGQLFVRADRDRLRQVVLNLLSNAIKFTEKGDITLTARCDRDGAPVRIEVQDTGIGIPPDRVAAIFNSFEQADSGTARRFGGTGLGLAISRSLCGQMGFTLNVESEPGVGSTFIVGLAEEARAAR
jgi:PAS domain S-box-containing protein